LFEDDIVWIIETSEMCFYCYYGDGVVLLLTGDTLADSILQTHVRPGLIPGGCKGKVSTEHGNQEFAMELQCRMGKLGPYADLGEVMIEIIVGISVPNCASLSHSEHVPPTFLTPPCEIVNISWLGLR
jgi:hypothetical protein